MQLYPKKRYWMTILLASLLTLLAYYVPLFAAERPAEGQALSTEQIAQLIEDGQKLASEKCASCHSIERDGNSTNKDAPPFRTFASKWPLESLEESLAEGIVTGHEEMPEAVFTPEQITAFLQFLESLQTK